MFYSDPDEGGDDAVPSRDGGRHEEDPLRGAIHEECHRLRVDCLPYKLTKFPFRAMRNYVDCVRYPIRYECGYRAWALVRELIVRPTQALLPGCVLSSAGSYLILMPIIVIILSFI